jgi:hypothetical protein
MFYHWNDGAPRKAKVTGSGNRQKLVLDDGVVVTGKINADPDFDLYKYEETGPRPAEYEREGPMTYSLDGDTITAARSVVDMPLDQAKQRHKQKVKQQRDTAASGGLAWDKVESVETDPGDPNAEPPVPPTFEDVATTYFVQTDGDSRRELTGAVLAINEGSLTEQAWRMADNTVAVLPAADFKAMALEVRAHVNAAYLRQAELEAMIDAAADVAALREIDVAAGWPVNPEAE